MVSIYSVYSFFINRIFLFSCPRFLCFGSHDPNEWFQAAVPLSHGILFSIQLLLLLLHLFYLPLVVWRIIS